MLLVGVGAETLPEPIATIQKAANRANLIPPFVIFDEALRHPFDVGWIVVEITNEQPNRGNRLVENAAVVGCNYWRYSFR